MQHKISSTGHSRRVFISGLGQHSAVGSGMPALQKAAVELRTGAYEPELQILMEQTVEGPREIKRYVSAEPPTPEGVSENVARRMSRITKMFLAATGEALRNAGITEKWNDSQALRVGLVVGSAFSTLQQATAFQRSVITGGAVGSSPTQFAGSVQNSVAAQLSMIFGIQGPTSTVMSMEQTVVNSFRLAYDWLAENLVDQVIVVVGDEVCEYNSYAMAYLPKSESLDVDSDECTTILGEGASAFVLSREGFSLGNAPLCEVKDIRIYTEHAPKAGRIKLASYGGLGQRSRHQLWLQQDTTAPHIQQHAKLYGGMLTGLGFEIALAALEVQADAKPTACVQVTDHSEAQSLILCAVK